MAVVADGPGRLLWPASANDVCCIVKRYASDRHPSQADNGKSFSCFFARSFSLFCAAGGPAPGVSRSLHEAARRDPNGPSTTESI